MSFSVMLNEFRRAFVWKVISDIPTWFIKKLGQKFENECLIMPPPWLGGGKSFNIRCAQMASNSFFPTFWFQGELYFLCFFQKLKKNTFFSFILPLISSDITLQESRVTFYFNVSIRLFWRKFRNKFRAVYNWTEMTHDRTNRMFSK